jgi:hypothetical protein
LFLVIYTKALKRTMVIPKKAPYYKIYTVTPQKIFRSITNSKFRANWNFIFFNEMYIFII